MTKEQQHDFTFTTSEVAKLSAVLGVGLMILKNPRVCIALAKQLPGFALSLSVGHALLGNTPVEEWDELSAEDQTIKLNDGIVEAMRLGNLFADISIMAYADEAYKQEFLAEKNRPPTYDPNVS